VVRRRRLTAWTTAWLLDDENLHNTSQVYYANDSLPNDFVGIGGYVAGRDAPFKWYVMFLYIKKREFMYLY
jgi:hypothetical protein